MLILDKLWNGEIYPSERKITGLSECRREVNRAEEQLRVLLTPEEKECLEAYDSARGAMDSLLEQDAFYTGFRTAGLLLLDILCGADAQ